MWILQFKSQLFFVFFTSFRVQAVHLEEKETKEALLILKINGAQVKKLAKFAIR